MATTRASTSNAAVEVGDGTTPPSVGTPTPTVTHYQQVAAEFMSALDEISQIIPKLEAIHVSTANLATDSLLTYDVAKGLARDPNSATIASLVQNMKRDLGRRGRPKTPLALRKTTATPGIGVPTPRLLPGQEGGGDS